MMVDTFSTIGLVLSSLCVVGLTMQLCRHRCCKWRLCLLRCINFVRWLCKLPCNCRRNHWEDPGVFAENKLPAHAPLRYCRETGDALSSNSSARVLDLTQKLWRFKLFDNPATAKAATHIREHGFNDKDWAEVPVPSNWQMLGFAPPCYTNIVWPFTFVPLFQAPSVPELNPTGVYRTLFQVPSQWMQGGRVRLVFHAAGPAIIVWVDGTYVGYSQDSMTAAEFDITDALQASDDPNAPLLSEQPAGVDIDHVLVVAVLSWCDGTYLEDQDQWWLTGIHRKVELHSVPDPLAIADYQIYAGLEDGVGVLRLRVDLSAPAMSGTSLRLNLRVNGDASAEDPALFSQSGQMTHGNSVWDSPEIRIPAVSAWSAETPSLYILLIELLDADGSILQAESAKVGFRNVSILGGRLCINGSPVVIAGANVHEMHPVRGKALTEDDMKADILMLKRGNFNAVRNSHYPHHPRWYELCDEYGLYVVDEANIETHGFATNLALSSLACDPAWAAQFLHRVQNMFGRAKNHACVIVWSLGNESGWGPNFSAGGRWLRERDVQRRPVQYEGGQQHGDATFLMGDGQHPESDIVCPMYWGPDMILPLGCGERPVILCEYTHAMGNSNGSLRSYWDLFWSDAPEHRRLQGGFVWEWADGAIKVPKVPFGISEKTGMCDPDQYFLKGELGYGGDFGPDSGTGDAHFIVDGLLFPDRTPHPGYFEAKRLQQPLKFSLLSPPGCDASVTVAPTVPGVTREVRLAVRNRYAFRSLDHLELHWWVRDASGCVQPSGTHVLTGVPPGEETTLCLQVPAPGQEVIAYGQWLFVEAKMREDDSDLVPMGHVVAQDGFTICCPDPLSVAGDDAAHANGDAGHALQTPLLGTQLCCGSVAPVRSLGLQGVVARQVTQDASCIEAPGYVARVCDGAIISLRAPGGEELLAGRAFDHCFFRAPTDNDRCGADCFVPVLLRIPLLRSILSHMGVLSLVAGWRMAGLDKTAAKLSTCEWDSSADGPTLRVVQRHAAPGKSACFETETKYVFGASEIAIRVAVEALPAVNGLTSLPRVGTCLPLSAALSRFSWLGCGPGESYPDRKAANDWAVHCGDVDAQHVDYIVPSENGGKSDVHWAALTDPKRPGSGVLLQYLCDENAPQKERPGDAPAAKYPASIRGAQVNVSRWTLAELDEARHNWELPDRGTQALAARPIQLHVDTAHMGIGGAGQGNDKLWSTASQFWVKPRGSHWTYAVHLRPLTPENWIHNGDLDQY